MSPTPIFISWSGTLSKEVALALRELLGHCSDQFKPWMSDRDIDSGARGMDEIATQLAETQVGISVVTAHNETAPWLNFEAGALSKQVGDKARVIPLLVGVKLANLQPGPLIPQFQAR